MLPIFPVHLFSPEQVAIDIAHDVVSGGTSLAGEQDLIDAGGGGRWMGTYSGLGLEDPYLRRVWDAWTSELAGGATSVLMPLLSVDTGPRPIAGNSLAMPSDLFVNDDYFPTEVRFASPHIIATVAGNVALRATTMTVAVSQGAALQPGMKFSVGVWAYKVQRITARDGLTATIKFGPPARAAISAGAAANFDWPCVVARAATGQDLTANIISGLFGDTSLQFVEDTAYAG